MIDIQRLEGLEEKATSTNWEKLSTLTVFKKEGVYGNDANEKLILYIRNSLPEIITELRASRKLAEAAKHDPSEDYPDQLAARIRNINVALKEYEETVKL